MPLRAGPHRSHQTVSVCKRYRGCLPVVAAFAVILTAGSARAQQGAGALSGVVADNTTRQPLPGVVVMVKSPALQEDQIAATDDAGFYRLANLPPGIYSVSFERDGYFPSQQGGIALRSDVTLRVNALMVPSTQQQEDIVLTVRPTVDVGSSTASTTLSSELIKRVPVSAPGAKGGSSRTIESVAAVAPAANNDLYGVGISGATSPENHYSVDGLSIGNPGKGVLGTQLSTEFVEEVNVVTAGYMPEFGRSSGGILNVVTKSGSNEFHGGVWSFVSPGALEAEAKRLPSDLSRINYTNSLNYIGDIGFDLGGPIIKDKLWFYAGMDVSNVSYDVDRAIHRTVGLNPDGTGGTIETTPLYSQKFGADARTYQGIAKLTYSINADNRLTLAAFGTPVRSGGGASFDGTNMTPGRYGINPLNGYPEAGGSTSYSASAHQWASTPIDTNLKWNSQFLGKKLLLDVMLGWHHQVEERRAADGSTALSSSPNELGYYYNVNWRRTADPMANRVRHSITEFEQFPGMERCNEAQASCAVDDYVTGAPRDLAEQSYDRYQSSVIISYLANFLGHHLIKVGLDGEITTFQHSKSNRVFAESENGMVINDEERFGYLLGPDQVQFIDPLQKNTRSMILGGFLQDSWSVMDKVTVNLGIRYDNQYFYNNAGNIGLSLPNMWSPRLGVIYDPTQEGRAKLFVNYARYYQNAPLDFADVILVGEPQVRGGHASVLARPNGGCNPAILSQHRTQCQDPANLVANSQNEPRLPNKVFTGGGLSGNIDPEIKASSQDEVSAGAEYELLPDARLGLTMASRWINYWIEDVAPVVGLNGFVGNPGFGLAQDFPKAKRNYLSLTLFLAKNFSNSWLAQASYTTTRLRGNYMGLFSAEDGYLGPNGLADFDSPNVPINRDGPLPGDIRHNIKLVAAKDWRVTNTQSLGTGISMGARSGRPTSHLGTDRFTYPGMSYLVARGLGERLPWTFGLDVQLAYRVAVLGATTLSLTADIFNLLNLQGVVQRDEVYTNDNVDPKPGATLADLPNLRDAEGGPIEEREDFGKATAWQAPRVFRFGLRGEF
jgi:hypothetical protein